MDVEQPTDNETLPEVPVPRAGRLGCEVCFRRYSPTIASRQPYVGQCGHSFCFWCSRRLRGTCGKCRRPFIPEKNFALIDFLESMNALKLKNRQMKEIMRSVGIELEESDDGGGEEQEVEDEEENVDEENDEDDGGEHEAQFPDEVAEELNHLRRPHGRPLTIITRVIDFPPDVEAIIDNNNNLRRICESVQMLQMRRLQFLEALRQVQDQDEVELHLTNGETVRRSTSSVYDLFDAEEEDLRRQLHEEFENNPELNNVRRAVRLFDSERDRRAGLADEVQERNDQADDGENNAEPGAEQNVRRNLFSREMHEFLLATPFMEQLRLPVQHANQYEYLRPFIEERPENAEPANTDVVVEMNVQQQAAANHQAPFNYQPAPPLVEMRRLPQNRTEFAHLQRFIEGRTENAQPANSDVVVAINAQRQPAANHQAPFNYEPAPPLVEERRLPQNRTENAHEEEFNDVQAEDNQPATTPGVEINIHIGQPAHHPAPYNEQPARPPAVAGGLPNYAIEPLGVFDRATAQFHEQRHNAYRQQFNVTMRPVPQAPPPVRNDLNPRFSDDYYLRLIQENGHRELARYWANETNRFLQFP